MPRTTRLVYLMCGFSSSDMTNDCECQSGKKKAQNSKQVAEDAADSLYEPEQWTRYRSIIHVLKLVSYSQTKSFTHYSFLNMNAVILVVITVFIWGYFA